MTAHAPTAVICGIGGYVPSRVVSNHELEARLDTSDTWIRTRTGIAARHVIEPGTATSDLAVEAGARALASTHGKPADALLPATTTPDRPCPATAPEVAARLGLGPVPAFDVAAVCSGFLYGLAAASGLIAAGTACRVLLIAADGAGAVVLRSGERGEPGAVGRIVLGSDGTLGDLIQVPAGGSRQRSRGLEAAPGDLSFRMQGRETYRHAARRMTEASRAAVAAAGWTIEDVDRLAAHQANGRILATVAEELGLPEERRLANIERVGNTGAASVPLLLAQSAADGSLAPGHRLLMTAFGGGLAWGAATAVWPDVKAC